MSGGRCHRGGHCCQERVQASGGKVARGECSASGRGAQPQGTLPPGEYSREGTQPPAGGVPPGGAPLPEALLPWERSREGGALPSEGTAVWRRCRQGAQWRGRQEKILSSALPSSPGAPFRSPFCCKIEIFLIARLFLFSFSCIMDPGPAWGGAWTKSPMV